MSKNLKKGLCEDDFMYSPTKAQVLNRKSLESSSKKPSISGSGQLTRFGFSETKQNIQVASNIEATASEDEKIFKVNKLIDSYI